MEKFAILAGFLLGIVALSASGGLAHAALTNYSFTASEFGAGTLQNPPSGSFQYETAFISDPIMAISRGH